MATAAPATTVDTWVTYDPENWESKFSPSLIARAKKRRVYQPGNWPFNRFVVVGDPKLDDCYDHYEVTFDGRLYHCTCRGHAYGNYRKLCSHALAVMMFRRAKKNGASGANAANGSPRPMVPHEAADGEGEGEPVVAAVEADPLPNLPTIPEDQLPGPRDEEWGFPPLPEWVTEFRPHQVAAVLEAVEAFESGERVVMCDAPTGSGKTLIGELVRRRLQTRGLYVCSTKSLQAQVLRDFPYARVLMGRANYPTLDHPELFDQTDAWGNRRLTAADCVKGLAELPACDGCPAKASGTRMHCQHCHFPSDCPYERAKADALEADLAVLNTAYFLTEANAVGKFSGPGLVIVDEADLLEQELMGQVEVRVGQRLQKKLGLDGPTKKTVEESWVEWVGGQAIPKVEAALKKLPMRTADIAKLRERMRLERLLGKLRLLDAELGEGRWVFTGYAEGEIAFRPVRVDHLGPKWLWKHAERWLLLSATLISAEEMAESLGLEGAA